MANKAEILFTGNAAQLERTIAGLNDRFRQFQASLPTRAVEAFNGALASLGLGLSLGALAAFVRTGAEAAARFQDLAEMTGASAEALAGLQTAAAVGGTTVAELAAAMNKLTKGLSGADEETKGAAAAVQALGFNLAAFKRLAPEDQFEAIAKRLSEFRDGSNQSAYAMALFGRAGASVLPTLKALAEQGGRTSSLTREQIALADRYADRQSELRSRFEQMQQVVGVQALPAMTAFKGALVEATAAMVGFDRAGSELTGRQRGLTDLFFTLAKGAAIVVESFIGIGRALRAFGGSVESVIADIQVVGEGVLLLSNPFSKENWAGLRTALDRRAQVAREANQRYIDLWMHDGTRISQAIARAQGIPVGIESGELRRLLNAQHLAGLKPPLRDLGGGNGASGRDRESAAEQLLRQLQEEIARTQDLTRAEEILRQLQEKRYADITPAQRAAILYAAQQVDAEREFMRAVKDSEDAVKKANVQQQQLNEERRRLIDDLTGRTAARDQSRKLSIIDEEFFSGRINAQEFDNAVRAIFGMKDKAREAFDEMTEFARQAARNIQDAFADFFFNVMQGNFERLDLQFKAAIDRMVANALAARIAEKLFGDFTRGGDFGGIIGGFFKGLFGGPRAEGGPVAGGRAYLVGERGPELFVPNASGRIMPNARGAGVTNIVVNVQGGATRETANQIATRVGRELVSAQARGFA